jgi:hypothetical protein
MSGQGTYIFNGTEEKEYQGQFQGGIINGKGKMLSYTHEYIGQFINGIYNGQGTMKDFTDGSVYIGEFMNGRKHGKGHQVEQNHTFLRLEYEGMWENGKRHGKGKEIIERSFNEPVQVVEGRWVEGVRVKDH